MKFLIPESLGMAEIEDKYCSSGMLTDWTNEGVETCCVSWRVFNSLADTSIQIERSSMVTVSASRLLICQKLVNEGLQIGTRY